VSRIVHLSDLHFGRARPELVEPLLETIAGLAPDLVAISGDLTQRARPAQFAAARAFLDRLPAPWLAVPGNHDVPLDNLPARFLQPWSRWRRWIARDLEPVAEARGALVVGMNTVDRFAWQRGRLSATRLGRITSRLRAGPAAVRVVVAHHPLELDPEGRKTPMVGGERGLAALAAAGADLVLSGHLHSWRAGVVTSSRDGRGAVGVQAGTGLSTRLRGEENDFNLVETARDGIEIERFVAAEGGEGFTSARRVRFRRAADGWRRQA